MLKEEEETILSLILFFSEVSITAVCKAPSFLMNCIGLNTENASWSM